MRNDKGEGFHSKTINYRFREGEAEPTGFKPTRIIPTKKKTSENQSLLKFGKGGI